MFQIGQREKHDPVKNVTYIGDEDFEIAMTSPLAIGCENEWISDSTYIYHVFPLGFFFSCLKELEGGVVYIHFDTL